MLERHGLVAEAADLQCEWGRPLGVPARLDAAEELYPRHGAGRFVAFESDATASRPPTTTA